MYDTGARPLPLLPMHTTSLINKITNLQSLTIVRWLGCACNCNLTPRSFLACENARRPSATAAQLWRAVAGLVALHVFVDRPKCKIIVGVGTDADILTPEIVGFVLTARTAVAENSHRRVRSSAAGDGNKERRGIIVHRAAMLRVPGDCKSDSDISVAVHRHARHRQEQMIGSVLKFTEVNNGGAASGGD